MSYGNYTTLIELLPLTVARMSDKKLGGFGRFFAFSLGFYRAVHQARALKSKGTYHQAKKGATLKTDGAPGALKTRHPSKASKASKNQF